MLLLPLLLALSLGADKPKEPEKSSDTVKGLLKDAASGAATDEKKADAPDVSKLPFTPETIKQIVASYQPQIQTCYEETLAAKDKAVEGKLATRFVIAPDGMVKSAKIDKAKSTLKDPKLHDCVTAVLSTMVFPKPPSGKDQPIDFPFNLKAVH